MLSRLLSLRAAWLPTLGTALVFISSIAVMAEDRVRLREDVLARSRGSSPLVSLTQSSCNLLDGNFPCSSVGDACTVCDRNTFTDLAKAKNGNGGYKYSGLASCGDRYTGICQVGLICSQDSRVAFCHAPNGVAVQ